MRAFRVLAFLLTATLVAACSTTITTRQGLEPEASGHFRFEAIEATSALGSVTSDDLALLKKAVADRVAKLPRGTRAAKVDLTVTEMDIVSEGTRFLVGALAGNSRMTVVVKVIDESGKTVADFDVQRTTNPGGYGMFFDQKAATIDAVADGVADILGGRNAERKEK